MEYSGIIILPTLHFGRLEMRNTGDIGAHKTIIFRAFPRLFPIHINTPTYHADTLVPHLRRRYRDNFIIKFML